MSIRTLSLSLRSSRAMRAAGTRSASRGLAGIVIASGVVDHLYEPGYRRNVEPLHLLPEAKGEMT